MKRSTTLTFLFLSLLALLVLAGPAAPVARAASYVVTNTNDSGPGSLRQAILEANEAAGADTIAFDVGGTIELGSTLPTITDPVGLTIDGAGKITISGDNRVQVMVVANGAKLTIANLTVANGNSAGFVGGGIFNAGALAVSNSTFSGNSTGGAGGGIYNIDGTLTVSNSTFSGNSAGFFGGGGIYNVGTGTLAVSNSTFAGNEAGNGGAIFNGSNDTVTVSNSTFAGNTTNRGGVISNFGGTVTLKNTIVADSAGENCQGSLTDGGGNLDSDGSCGFTELTSLSNIDPMLGALADNGGPSQTMALLFGSPAVDAAVDCPPPDTDQRGVSRPQGACDIGAFELTTREAIANLQGGVQALVDSGALNQGQGNALNSVLDTAIKKLDQGKPETAVNNLNAFINQVEDFIAEGVLSEAEGQPLIDEANRIIAAIEAG